MIVTGSDEKTLEWALELLGGSNLSRQSRSVASTVSTDPRKCFSTSPVRRSRPSYVKKVINLLAIFWGQHTHSRNASGSSCEDDTTNSPPTMSTI